MCNLNDEIVHKNVALVFSFKAQDSHFSYSKPCATGTVRSVTLNLGIICPNSTIKESRNVFIHFGRPLKPAPPT